MKNKVKSRAGKLGQKSRMKTILKRRHELFIELSKYVDKKILEYIQFSRVRWSNKQIKDLIEHYQNDRKTFK